MESRQINSVERNEFRLWCLSCDEHWLRYCPTFLKRKHTSKGLNSSKHVLPGAPGEASRCRRRQQSGSVSLVFIMKTEGVRKRWNLRENLKQPSRRPQGRGGLRSSRGSRNYWRAQRNKGNAAGKQRRRGAKRKRRELGRDTGISARGKGKLAAQLCWLLSSALLDTVK